MNSGPRIGEGPRDAESVPTRPRLRGTALSL